MSITVTARYSGYQAGETFWVALSVRDPFLLEGLCKSNTPVLGDTLATAATDSLCV